MKKQLGIAILSALLVVTLGLSACQRRADKPANAAFLLDVSDSQTINCECLAAVLNDTHRLANLKRGSQLLLFNTGNQSTAYEPSLAGSLPLPESRNIEGRQASQRKRAEWVKSAQALCQAFPVADVTPLFLGLQSTLEQLQTVALTNETQHTLFVKTDGEETVDLMIKEALRNPKFPLERLPKLDNRQTRVVFLGFSETIGQTADSTERRTANRTPEHVNRLKQVWRAIFTNPDAVTFEPHCAPTAATQQLAQAQ